MPAGRLGRLALRAFAALGALLLLGLGALALLWLTLPDPRAWATRNPPTTALMEQRRAEATRARRPWKPYQVWVGLERISPRLIDAVVASEDATFFEHRGFDWASLQETARLAWASRRLGRGASTISQQVAKNLYLGTERSLLRKVREALLTVKLERALPKRRILTLYLDVAEWGEGVFGVEAGARRHLGTGAASLSTAQAVLLAVMLPAPRRADLSRPSPWLRERSSGLLERLHAEHLIGDEEYRTARVELARLVGTSVPSDARAEPPEEEAAAEPAPAPTPTPSATADVTPSEPGPEPAATPEPTETAAPTETPPTPTASQTGGTQGTQGTQAGTTGQSDSSPRSQAPGGDPTGHE
jgi:monofunctional biosynthetic peptidoglycan transglycosylase